MNKERRAKLRKAIEYIEKAKDIVDDVSADEGMAFDNLSEGLQQTDRGEQMEDNVDSLDDASDTLDEAISSIEDAMI